MAPVPGEREADLAESATWLICNQISEPQLTMPSTDVLNSDCMYGTCPSLDPSRLSSATYDALGNVACFDGYTLHEYKTQCEIIASAHAMDKNLYGPLAQQLAYQPAAGERESNFQRYD